MYIFNQPASQGMRLYLNYLARISALASKGVRTIGYKDKEEQRQTRLGAWKIAHKLVVD